MALTLQSGDCPLIKKLPITPGGGVSSLYSCIESPSQNRVAYGFSRSRQMVSLLRGAFIYTEKRARDMLFREIEEILQRSPTTVTRLTREAAAKARSAAEQVQYTLSNWDTASKATVNAMLGAGALLDSEHRVIQPGIRAPAAAAAALADQYRDLTETYLLEYLIRTMGDVTARDHIALAHALFRQFDRSIPIGELEDRVAILLAGLSDRVTMGAGGVYHAVAAPS